MLRASATLLVILALALPSTAQKRKKKEDDLVLPPVLEEKVIGRKKVKAEVTQTLEELPDPPAAIVAETRKLSFHVAPMTAKGLLSQQARDAIKTIWRLNRGDNIVKLRAFVAGTGDLRRVQAVVSEEFASKRVPLPVITVVQVGALPMEGAQVAIETVSAGRRDVNRHGLAFLSGQAVAVDEELLDVAPLTAKSIGQLRAALAGVGLAPADVLRATCFCSSLHNLADIRRLVTAEYPTAALTIVQMQRGHTRGLVECEAIARLKAPVGAPLKLVNPPGLASSPNYSQVALVSAGRVAFSGSQMAFRAQDEDVRLAFERLSKSMEPTGASLRQVAMSSIYPLSSMMTDKVRALRFEFYDKSRPPASTMLLFEGLPSLDASFAVDVVAVID